VIGESFDLATKLPATNFISCRILHSGNAMMLDKYLVRDDENIVYAKFDGEVAMLTSKDNRYRGLNSLATFIWEQADGRTKVERIIEKICQEFDVDRHTAEKDRLEFINELISKGLVTLSPNSVEG
jgi:methyltransferase-like protein